MQCIKSLSSPILVFRFAVHSFSATTIEQQQIQSILKRSVVLIEANLRSYSHPHQQHLLQSWEEVLQPQSAQIYIAR